MHVPFAEEIHVVQRNICAIRPFELRRLHNDVGQLLARTLDNNLECDRLIARRFQPDTPCSSIPNEIGLLVTGAHSVRKKFWIILERLVAYGVDTN
ncbi:MAG: hypothetical protein ACR2JB_04460 [Bryobacteraceae bacterium]